MRKYLYIIICIAALAACKREIDFDFREVEPILTIEGRVTDEGTEVLLTRSRSVYDAAKPKGLPGAQVIVSADGLQEHLTYDEATGFYRSPLKGQPGTTYCLTVDLEGHHYEATSFMYPPAPLLSAEFLWQPINQERTLVYELWATDPQPDVRNHYWYRMDRTYHHPHFAEKTTHDAYRWNVFDDRGCPPGRVFRDVMCMSEKVATEDDKDNWDKILYEGDTITMRLMVIDQPTFDYLRSLSTGQRNGANPVGNIKGDPCLGYFMAASVTHADTIVFRYADVRDAK